MALEKLIDENPRLLTDRLDAGEGYFREPYLLWFVAGNPVRTETLPATIPEIASAIVERAKRAGVESLGHQAGYTLGLVASGRVPRESGVQSALIDVLCDAGADPNGPLVAALAHRETEAAHRLLERGAALTLLAAACLNRMEDVHRLAGVASAESRQAALVGASLYGNPDCLGALISTGVNLDEYGPVWFHPHATALHQAVDSGSLQAIDKLVGAGASIEIRDRVYGGTARDWATHLGRDEIAAYLLEAENSGQGRRASGPPESSRRVRSVVAMLQVTDLQRSSDFYAKLGFRVADSFASDGGPMTWAWLESGAAQLMLARAEAPILAEAQTILFYAYFDDVVATRSHLEAAGIEVGSIAYPFYAPRGEFKVKDPDGYSIMVTHT